ncbi:ABC-type glycerol-3-phosphate transport system substrate-binding protein [Anaerosolibacter carboniphilus]|uniref:ABC-type glycerol-3-phosphate transport system substrate-binding protein n=1 Tax=Anaerosolibacter carboniphilus TaxID=1417629 RepID=A0A841KPM1_9FIRM|nr:extracellular solute-binding protein [Anaerosolibacter carboniphilus]MBB6215387.1 ABC-type glycerol-3-phosphate transport system substrate-binding protein [Anaerosolibacter carboniphilus]
MFKKMISLLLIVMLIVSLSACGSESKNVSQQQNLSTYTETEIGSNSGLIWPGGSRVNSKSQLVVFDRGNGTNSGFVTLDQDGKPVGDSKLSFSGNVRAFALDGQDNIYVVTTEPKSDNNISQNLTVLTPQGNILKTIDLGTFSGTGSNGMKNTGFTDIAIDINESIYLSNPLENIQVFDKEGQKVKSLGAQGYESIDIDSEGNIIAGNFLGNRIIEKIDVSTGKSVWSIDLSAQNSSGVYMMGSNRIRFSKGDESIYYITSQDITKYDSSGKLIGTVVDFKSYTILASGYNISDMDIDAAGNIYVTTTSVPAGGGVKIKSPGNNSNNAAGGSSSGNGAPLGNIKYELFKYTLQSGGSTAQNQEVITVSVPISNRGLEIAASKFQKDHPGYRIDIQTYPSSDYETYVKNLNTQILSGKGPDIISVAGLPYENYISKNILANLSEMMIGDKNFDTSEYYTNIFDALKYNGDLYVLPTDFTFNILMANQGILDQKSIKIDNSKWTWNDFKSIAEQVTQKDGNGGTGNRAALPSVSSSDLLDLFTGGSYSSYIDDGRKANFTSQEFMDLLNTVKAFSDDSLVDRNVKMDMVSILEAAGREAIVFYPYTITDYNMYGFMKAAFKEQLSLYNMPSAGGSNGGTFTSNSMYGINRNSKYKSESWEFLKTLLSDDVQSLSMQGMAVQSKAGGPGKALGGFSVNKAAQQQKAQQAIDASQSGNMKMMMKSGNASISLSPAPMSQSDIDYINKFISELKIYANADANIGSIIQDETKAFFSGAKSVEETTKLIQDRVNTYLGE